MQLGRKILDKERRVLGAAAGAQCAPHPALPRGQVSSSAAAATPGWGPLLFGVGVCLHQTWLVPFQGPPSLCSPDCPSPPSRRPGSQGRDPPTPRPATAPRSSELPQPSACTGWRETTALPALVGPPAVTSWGSGAAGRARGQQSHTVASRRMEGRPRSGLTRHTPPDPCPDAGGGRDEGSAEGHLPGTRHTPPDACPDAEGGRDEGSAEGHLPGTRHTPPEPCPDAEGGRDEGSAEGHLPGGPRAQQSHSWDPACPSDRYLDRGPCRLERNLGTLPAVALRPGGFGELRARGRRSHWAPSHPGSHVSPGGSVPRS
uniref:Translation initiation factor IF-2-like n=1 Tax=Tursiops truncatus TaxID=9739 RepID=A0A6J3RJN7_TURTR|nr:translation initiation factor IF-2-like [Tursiops truncatus]